MFKSWNNKKFGFIRCTEIFKLNDLGNNFFLKEQNIWIGRKEGSFVKK